MKTRGCLLTEDLPGDPMVCPLIAAYVDDLYVCMPEDVFRRYISPLTFDVAGTFTTDPVKRRKRRAIARRELLSLIATVHGDVMARKSVRSVGRLKPRRLGSELSESFDVLVTEITGGNWQAVGMHAGRVLLELCRVSGSS